MSTTIQRALKSAGHTELLEIQQACVEACRENNQVVLLSQTGSGKTIAFLLSLLENLDPENKDTQAVILAPTRELCLQIEEVFKSLKSGYKITACYGGHSTKSERNSLSETPSVIVATPGRLCDHIRREHANLKRTRFLVIDEFDKCLEFGFTNDMTTIRHEFQRLDHTVLTSATDMQELPAFLNMRTPKVLNYLYEIEQPIINEYLVPFKGDLLQSLAETIISFGLEKSIIFVNYREVTEDVADFLEDSGLIVSCYHGGMKQDLRERELIKFANGTTNVIVCTDLGARGIDIDDIQHVVHYQYPGSESAYIHRKGRTARMGKTGNSYLFMNEHQQLPEYVERPEETYNANQNMDCTPLWDTLFVGGGKKEKINKIDIVGFLSKVGQLQKHEVGKIDVKDHFSYVAVARPKVKATLQKVRDQRMKGKKIKIGIAR
ncbi:MAG: DEAD/DEAH box helicase [Crocinitomicaceae bacterium]|nr:DEAD/DEAH box helicase [Crocinitomicaceae bacterium]